MNAARVNAITRGIGQAMGQGGAQPLAVGLALYDGQRRLSFASPAFADILGVPPTLLQLGSAMADNVRVIAERGALGSGDWAAQAMNILRLNPARSQVLRQRRADGRCYDASFIPIPGDGYALCLVETTGIADQEAGAAGIGLADLRVGVAVFGPDRRLLRSNAGFGQMIGLTDPGGADLIVAPGTTFWQLIQDLHGREDYATADGEAFLAGQISLDRTQPHQVRRTRVTGQVIEFTSDPQPDGGWSILVADVSHLARAEAGCRRRADMLDSVLRHVPHGVCVWDRDHRVLMFNEAYGTLTRGAFLRVGDRFEHVIKRHAEAGEFGPGAPEQLAAQHLARDMSRPQAFTRRRADGTALDVRTTPLPHGGFVMALTEAAVGPQAGADTGSAAEPAPFLASRRHGIVVWGPDRCVRAANRTAETLQEVRPGTFALGRSVEEIAAELPTVRRPRSDESDPGRDQGRDQGRDHAHRQLGIDAVSQPATHLRTTPSGRVLETHIDPSSDGGWVATYTDVTEQQRLEAELRQARTGTPTSGPNRSHILSTMSHELRTPLNAVIGFSDALMRAGRDGTANLGQVEEYGESINKSGRDLLTLIDTILDATRLESGQFELANDRVDLHYLVRTCVKQAQGAADAANVSLDVSLPDDLPLFRGDERRLRQVLAQLLTNAIKFTDTQAHGTVQVFAQYAPRASEDDADVLAGKAARDLLICVADNGIGIPDTDLERVFEPFMQVDTSLSRRVEGSGLGLYIGRALMRAHGGDLVLRSRVREGTTAVLRLPAARLLPSIAPIPISMPSLPQSGSR